MEKEDDTFWVWCLKPKGVDLGGEEYLLKGGVPRISIVLVKGYAAEDAFFLGPILVISKPTGCCYKEKGNCNKIPFHVAYILYKRGLVIKGVLIGDPVEQSISHVTHNAIFQKSGVSACYEKWVTTERDLGALRERDDVAWFAVTMPLKEVIAPYLDEGVGPVNTILVRDGRWIGYNIDGIACLNAIGDVRGKRVLVLGNGGGCEIGDTRGTFARCRGLCVDP